VDVLDEERLRWMVHHVGRERYDDDDDDDDDDNKCHINNDSET